MTLYKNSRLEVKMSKVRDEEVILFIAVTRVQFVIMTLMVVPRTISWTFSRFERDSIQHIMGHPVEKILQNTFN